MARPALGPAKDCVHEPKYIFLREKKSFRVIIDVARFIHCYYTGFAHNREVTISFNNGIMSSFTHRTHESFEK